MSIRRRKVALGHGMGPDSVIVELTIGHRANIKISMTATTMHERAWTRADSKRRHFSNDFGRAVLVTPRLREDLSVTRRLLAASPLFLIDETGTRDIFLAPGEPATDA